MTTSSSSFRVTLQDCDGIEHNIKSKAEARFAKVLERSFPDQEAMTRAYKLFNDAAEGGVISKADEKNSDFLAEGRRGRSSSRTPGHCCRRGILRSALGLT